MAAKTLAEKTITSSKLPSTYTDLGQIPNVRNISPNDIKKLDDMFNLDLNRKKKEFNFKCKKYSIFLIFGIITVFFIASFSATMDWIQNETLKLYFANAVFVSISSVVGFVLGYFYNK